MKLEFNCPRCNAIQKFGKQRREVEDEIEIFIRCSQCKWESVVFRGDSDKLLRERDIKKLKIRATRDPSLWNVLARRTKRK